MGGSRKHSLCFAYERKETDWNFHPSYFHCRHRCHAWSTRRGDENRGKATGIGCPGLCPRRKPYWQLTKYMFLYVWICELQLGSLSVNWFSGTCSQTHFQFMREVLLSLCVLPSKLKWKTISLIPNSLLLSCRLQGMKALGRNNEMRSHSSFWKPILPSIK